MGGIIRSSSVSGDIYTEHTSSFVFTIDMDEQFRVVSMAQVSPSSYCRLTNRPPSTSNDAPVTYLARSLARNTTGPAMSFGSVAMPSKHVLYLCIIKATPRTSKSAKAGPFRHSIFLRGILKVLLVDCCHDRTR